VKEFDFTQQPRAPLLLPVSPKTTLITATPEQQLLGGLGPLAAAGTLTTLDTASATIGTRGGPVTVGLKPTTRFLALNHDSAVQGLHPGEAVAAYGPQSAINVLVYSTQAFVAP